MFFIYTIVASLKRRGELRGENVVLPSYPAKRYRIQQSTVEYSCVLKNFVAMPVRANGNCSQMSVYTDEFY
nr:MAG TPA: hypothetical protein [Caudoviricetes sp.]